MSYGPRGNAELKRLTKRELMMEAVRNQAEAADVTVPAGTQGGYPVLGFNCEGRGSFSLKLYSEGAIATAYIEGRDDVSDPWAVLQKVGNESATSTCDADNTFTLAANESIWKYISGAPTNYVRVWLKNSTAADVAVKIRFNGGR